jgi:hypothetical protein
VNAGITPNFPLDATRSRGLDYPGLLPRQRCRGDPTPFHFLWLLAISFLYYKSSDDALSAKKLTFGIPSIIMGVEEAIMAGAFVV